MLHASKLLFNISAAVGLYTCDVTKYNRLQGSFRGRGLKTLLLKIPLNYSPPLLLFVWSLLQIKTNKIPPYQAELLRHWRVSWSCHCQGDHRVPLACALQARCTGVPRVAQCLQLVLQCLVPPLCVFPLQSAGPWTATAPTRLELSPGEKTDMGDHHQGRILVIKFWCNLLGKEELISKRLFPYQSLTFLPFKLLLNKS